MSLSKKKERVNSQVKDRAKLFPYNRNIFPSTLSVRGSTVGNQEREESKYSTKSGEFRPDGYH